MQKLANIGMFESLCEGGNNQSSMSVFNEVRKSSGWLPEGLRIFLCDCYEKYLKDVDKYADSLHSNYRIFKRKFRTARELDDFLSNERIVARLFFFGMEDFTNKCDEYVEFDDPRFANEFTDEEIAEAESKPW